MKNISLQNESIFVKGPAGLLDPRTDVHIRVTNNGSAFSIGISSVIMAVLVDSNVNFIVSCTCATSSIIIAPIANG
jgi:hypothetical protein